MGRAFQLSRPAAARSRRPARLTGQEALLSVSYGTEAGLLHAAGTPLDHLRAGPIARAHRANEFMLAGTGRLPPDDVGLGNGNARFRVVARQDRRTSRALHGSVVLAGLVSGHTMLRDGRSACPVCRHLPSFAGPGSSSTASAACLRRWACPEGDAQIQPGGA